MIHVQYGCASHQGKQTGALDLVIEYLIKEVYSDRHYFDFGISTENQGRVLNEGLIAQKEMFGGRAVAHCFYELLL